MTSEALAKAGPNYLFEEIKQRIAKQPIKFEMRAQLAAPSDRLDDPSKAWPDTRSTVVLGTLEIKKLGANTEEQDKELAFSPNNIPAGIETADPMLDFRSRAYPISVAERR